MSIHIDRCICFQQSFSALQTLARQTGAKSLEELQAQVVFGQKCRLCHPYVRRMLQTGQTVFNEILSPESEATQQKTD